MFHSTPKPTMGACAPILAPRLTRGKKNTAAALERKSCWGGSWRSRIQRTVRWKDDQPGEEGNQALDEDGGQGTRGGVVDVTTSQQTRDDRGGDEGHSNCDGDGKCLAATVTGFVDNDYDNDRQLPTTTQRVMLWWGQGAVGVVIDGDDAGGGCKPGGLDGEDAFVLTDDSAPTLIADNANGGDGGITVFGDAFEDTVARTGTAGASGVGTTTMGGGGGNYATLRGQFLTTTAGTWHPLGPLWRIRHGNHSCSRPEAMARADRFAATHSNGTTQSFQARDSKQARGKGCLPALSLAMPRRTTAMANRRCGRLH